jgi:hypothetical protein
MDIKPNKLKLIRTMILIGENFEAIAKQFNVSSEAVVREFNKIIADEVKNKKNTLKQIPTKYEYLISEEEIEFSLDPKYSVDELEGEELAILKELK